jgi:hypothetical protein
VVDLTPGQLHALLHTLGLEDPERREHYRNHYATGDPPEPDILALVGLGLMRQVRRPAFLPEGDRVYAATPEGLAAALAQRPKPPKRTRSQRRYREFVDWHEAFGGTFREFLRERGGDRG